MHRILKTLFWGAVVFAFAWLIHSLPGSITIDIPPYTVEISDSFAVVSLLALFVVLYLLVRLVMLAVRVRGLARCGAVRGGGGRASMR